MLNSPNTGGLMSEKEVIFKLKVDKKKAREHLKKYLEQVATKHETRLVREGVISMLTLLSNSDYVYVPESQASRYLPYIKSPAEILGD